MNSTVDWGWDRGWVRLGQNSGTPGSRGYWSRLRFFFVIPTRNDGDVGGTVQNTCLIVERLSKGCGYEYSMCLMNGSCVIR